MKPIRLKIAGLNSFISAQIIDFENLGQNNLFCISGCTGSGKTTIVDAIILALYGETKRGKLEEIVNLSCQKALVELTIELEGEVYTIVREIRKTGGSKAKIYGSNDVIIAENTTTVNEFIKQKIGLEKDQFTKVVMLQQGEFDKFLSDSKTERMATIEKLTDISKYKRAIRLLNEDENTAKNTLEIEESRLNEYSDVNDEILEQKVKEILEQEDKKNLALKQKEDLQNALSNARKKLSEYAVFKKREEEINALIISLKDIKKEKQEVENEKKQAKSYEEKLTNIKQELEKNAKTREVWAECKGVVDTLSSYEENIATARKTYKEVLAQTNTAKEELDELNKQRIEIENEYNFSYLTAQQDEQKAKEEHLNLSTKFNLQQSKEKELESKQKELKQSKKDLQNIDIQYEQLQKGVNAWKDKCEQLKNQKEIEQEKLEKMKNDNLIDAVLSTVKVGEVCPICGNIVTSVSHTKKQDFSSLEQTVKKLNEEYELSQKALLDSERSFSALLTSYNTLSESVKKQTNEVETISKDIGEIIDLSLVEKAKAKSENATRYLMLVQNCKKQTQIVEGKIEDLEKRKREGEELVAKQKASSKTLMDKCGTTSVKEIEENLILLKRKDEELNLEQNNINEFISKVSQNEVKILEQEKSKQALLENLQKEHTPCEKIDDKDVEELEVKFQESEKEYLNYVSFTATLVAQKNQLIARNEQRKALFSNIVKLRKQYELLKELKNLVKGASFTEFMVDAFMEEITLDASERMKELSSGQYSLYYQDGKFFVRDYFSSNEPRNVNTLSGGERFLASLSLAIAISRRTAQSKDYGFFFIDEGFGTLDENSICTVCDSLENLSRDTMVGIITHRNELIERIPSVLEVVKTDAETGSECRVKG